MLLQNLFNDPALIGVYLLAIICALTVHEWAHAITADHFGDPTPRSQGRTTLNPLAHLDPLGSLLFLIAGFGWGKPVLIDPRYLRTRGQELLVALAGPISNIVLALIGNILMAILLEPADRADSALAIWTSVNISLAAFNLIPIPPLDGSSIVAFFWPPYRSPQFLQYGSFALLILLLVGNGALLRNLLEPIFLSVLKITTLFGLIQL